MMKNMFGLRWNCKELNGILKLRFCRLVTMILQWLKDEQPEENTNTDCLVKEQENEYQTGWKIKTGIQQHNGLVDDTNVTLFAKVYCFLIRSGLSKVFWAEDTTRNIGFNESGKYKKTFIGSGVCTGSMQVLHGFEFKVESLGDHTFELARDKEQHLACELFRYKEDSNEAAFIVAAVEKIYANESLTFNNTIACKAKISATKGLLDKAKGNVLGMEIVRDQSGYTLRCHNLACERDLAKSSPHMLDVDKEDLDLSERNLKLCVRKIYDGHYTMVVRVLSSSGIALYNDATLKELKAKHPFKSAPSFPDIPIDHHRLIASKAVVLDRIKIFPRGTSYELVSSITQVVNLFLDGKYPMMLGEYIASAPLTPLVKLGGSIHSIDVGTVWRRLVFKVSAFMIGYSLDGYLDDLQFGVGVFGGGKMIELIIEDGWRCGLHLNVDKNEILWPKEDPRSMFEGVFSPNISRSLHGVKLIERIVTASRPGFGDSQWRLATLPFAFGGLGVYSASDALTYSFLASRLRHIFHTGTKDAESTFSLSPRHMALWKSQMEDHTLELAYGSSYFLVGTNYERVFPGDIYGYHAVSCADIIGIKHHHNVVRNTLIDICFRSWISVGKVVDIGLDEGCDKPLRPTYMLLYSWDGGLDVCVDLIGSLPLTQTGMEDFVSGRAVIDVEQCKRVKYMATYAAIVYGFLSFSFSSFGELEEDAVRLLKRIQKFPMAQDIGARASVYIFNRISFAIPKGVRAQIVFRFSSNFL
nr:hypothetical protein [Tanacetum cinerariifolium]